MSKEIHTYICDKRREIREKLERNVEEQKESGGDQGEGGLPYISGNTCGAENAFNHAAFKKPISCDLSHSITHLTPHGTYKGSG